jgi:hypothetical protein
MLAPQDLGKQMSEKTEQDLQAMLFEPDDWTPEALTAARAELQRRNIPVTEPILQDAEISRNVPDVANYETPPERQGLLAVYLIFKIVVAAGVLGIYILTADDIAARSPHPPRWILALFSITSFASILAAVAIFRWMKWGFYLSCALALIAFPINLALHVSFGRAFGGLLGPVILYGLLQLGGEKRAWFYLR